MSLALISGAAVVGAVIAPLLRSVVFRRSVPYGNDTRRACPACEAPLLPAGWRAGFTPLPPTGTCPACRARVGPPAALVEIAAICCLAAVAVCVHETLPLLAWSAFACGGIVLAFIDLAVHRLPNRVLAVTALGTLVPLAAQAVHSNQPGVLIRGLFGALGLGIVYLLPVLTFGQSMGAGDAKLAALVGAATATIGVSTVFTATLITFALGGLVAVVLLARRVARPGQQIAFGPFIIAGALIAVLLNA